MCASNRLLRCMQPPQDACSMRLQAHMNAQTHMRVHTARHRPLHPAPQLTSPGIAPIAPQTYKLWRSTFCASAYKPWHSTYCASNMHLHMHQIMQVQPACVVCPVCQQSQHALGVQVRRPAPAQQKKTEHMTTEQTTRGGLRF